MRKYPWLEDLDSIIYCPTCKKQIDDFWKGDPDNLNTFNPEFCPYCGQRLDWAETAPYGFREEHD